VKPATAKAVDLGFGTLGCEPEASDVATCKQAQTGDATPKCTWIKPAVGSLFWYATDSPKGEVA